MKVVRTAAALLGFAALLVAPAFAADAPKPIKQQDAKTAFDELMAQSKKAMSGFQIEKRDVGKGTASVVVADKTTSSRFNPVPVVVPGPTPTPVAFGVKIYASLADSSGKESGTFVCIPKYKWHSNEYFYVYLESTTPIQVGFYQDYPENGMITKTRQVLPDPNFPESYGTVVPGQAFKFPTLIKMDDSQEPEFMAIVCSVAGSSSDSVINAVSPMVGGDTTGGVLRGPALATAQQKGIDAIKTKAAGSANGRFMGVVPSVDPSNLSTAPTPSSISLPATSTTSPDDVSVIQFGPEKFGYTLFKLYK